MPINNHITFAQMEINVLSEVGKSLMPYDKSVEILDLPGYAGTQSMFNPYVVFSLYDVGQTEGTDAACGKYKYTSHFDMLPSGNATLQATPSVGVAGDFSSDVDALQANGFVAGQSEVATKYAGSIVRPSNDIAMRAVPTAKNIIEYNRNIAKVFGYGPAPYSWADFLYCKYYGKIPNNRLITLRRYPYPISDNVVISNSNAVVPVAQAVTWFSEETNNKLSDILKMSFGVNWKEIEAQVQEVNGNERGFGSGSEAFAGSKAVSAFGAVLTATRGSYDQWSGKRQRDIAWSKESYTNSGPYWNQIYGPVNVVHKSHMRDRGLKFQSDVTLKFHYSLNSYAGVNPKVAVLDILTNFLTLTYTNAKFWGGATRYFPNASFRVGFFGDQNKFYSGDFKGYATSIGTEMKSTLSSLQAGLSKILSGDFSSIMGTITSLIGGKLSEKTMPQTLSIRSMLSGEAVGEWHLTVGNPMNPIAVIGNLILEDTTMEFGETLGPDDFPTELIFTVKLKPGKPRDKGDVESLFNSGYGRMSYAPLTALPSMSNTFGKKGKKDEPADKIFNRLNDPNNTEGGKDPAVTLIRDRVTRQWGETFGNSANLLFMINATKSRF